MPPTEPTSERLETYLAQGFGHWTQQVHDVCRALLEAREEISQLNAQIETVASDWQDVVAERDSQIVALTKRLKSAEEGLETMGKVLMETHAAENALESQITTLRDEIAMLRGDPDAVHQGALCAIEALRQAQKITEERDSLRGKLEAAKVQIDDLLRPVVSEADQISSREPVAQKLIAEAYERGKFDQASADLALSEDVDYYGCESDAAIAEAEQRGYERGKAECEIAGLRRESGKHFPNFSSDTWINYRIAELERQLAARREKAEAHDDK